MSGRLGLRVNVIRMTQMSDDEIGGAVFSGTVYYSLPAAIMAQQPTQAAFNQGLESNVLYRLSVQGEQYKQTVHLYERDLIEVTAPADHPYMDWRFRIMGVLPSSVMHRRNTQQHATLSRIEESRDQSW